MKYYHIRGFFLPIAITFIGLYSSPLLVIPISVTLSVFFSMNPFAVEEKGQLNNLYLSLPVSRNAIVYGRFILAGMLAICGLAMGIPAMIIVNIIGTSHYYLPFSWYIFILALSYLLFSIFNFASYPILFKMGYIKGKFWGVVLPAVLMGVLYGVVYVISYSSGNEMLTYNILEYAYENMLLVSGGITIIATLFLGASIALSKHVYSKREF